MPVDRLYDAFVDESQRARWLPDGELRERTATRPKSARFDWGDGATRVNVVLRLRRARRRARRSVEHVRLPTPARRERMKAFWRERVSALKEELER